MMHYNCVSQASPELGGTKPPESAPSSGAIDGLWPLKPFMAVTC